ncbi:SDR family NAD(P)-dependent oxidoreductase [Halalkalibacter sp. APA_J-10(15)]|uniref:SDR family NAD(P)-dependent oxidoreductase n=1 Tax=Halalkalibacter sp. APA_J-10(15) TaxID=2933805 RepID=UPI001FF3AFED|nr:SDR family NAD(P)-dependent oxidoreductase [Halalkalibacter sp. APA_J-10(15)]MCK0471884.1 SDR family NAD(P)-dependent oxidoreductase [Halalkalibacter sp. APA_J-10(15)]
MGQRIDRKAILKMVKSGHINPEEALHLLKRNSSNSLGIAIIGMSGRFPGAKNTTEFWDNISSGKDCITEVPKDRWDVDDYYEENTKDLRKTYSKWGGFLNDIEKFDSLFFNISGKEAELTDPQQRLFLEECWNTLEDAGYANESIANSNVGVYVGVNGSGDYMRNIEDAGVPFEPQSFWGNDSSIIPSRISYLLNLKGPTLAINTACSSSLVALHVACRSIINNDCDMALVGGVYLSALPKFYIIASNAAMLSPDGKCRAFDDKANGFVPGEACGAVLIKPLEKAIEDGDNIYGVIEATGLNQDGRTNGITAPSSQSQYELEYDLYKKSNINPEEITYIETHGTGTKLGDPIEFEALKKAFQKFTDKKEYCALGSVKNNIGHTANAAGISSLIKVLLCLKHKKVPPHIYFTEENKLIDIKNSPFYINKKLNTWKGSENGKRIAAISSFGFSGTNSHVIIQEAPPMAERVVKRGLTFPFLFSAKTESAVVEYLSQFYYWINENKEEYTIQDISYTLCIRRQQYKNKIAFWAKNIDDLTLKLKKYIEGNGISFDIQEDMETYLKGQKVDFSSFFKQLRCYNVPLPTYAFQKDVFWVKEEEVNNKSENLMMNRFDYSGQEAFIREHVIEENKVFPFAGYIFELLEKMEKNYKDYNTIQNMAVERVLKVVEPMQLQFSMEARENDYKCNFKNDRNETYCSGIITRKNIEEEKYDIKALVERLSSVLSKEECYKQFEKSGMNYGVNFQLIENIYYNDHSSLAYINGSHLNVKENKKEYGPILIDAMLQSVLGVMINKHENSMKLPFAINEILVHRSIPTSFYAYCQKEQKTGKHSITILDLDGVVLLSILGLTIRESATSKKVETTEKGLEAKNINSMNSLENLLIKVLSEESKISADKIDVNQTFDAYGLDSLIMLNIINQLEVYFRDLSKTLLFENNSISELKQYLKEHYPKEVNALNHSANESGIKNVESPNDKGLVEGDDQLGTTYDKESIEEEFAIIGLSGKYPKSKDVYELWENLVNGRDCIEEVPQERWNPDMFEGVNQGKETFSSWGGFIEDVDKFDPLFFNISPKEAELMDPQERLFLETAWNTFEDAGYTRDMIQKNNKVGVYVGVMYGHYQLFSNHNKEKGDLVAASSSYATVANRVSYYLNLSGPSMAIDSMCSSSLTALHLGVKSLRDRECNMVLVGGVNLSLHPTKYVFLAQGKFASSEGRCKSFGVDGDGYVPGEGVGAILIKRLADAVNDGDHIYGVIKGSSINHGGKTSGYTVPNPKAQEMVIKDAIGNSGVDLQTINYIEAHGTGTSLGDPIEVNGLSRAFGRETMEPCYLGSVKSNVGHLESAAGIIAITKVLLQLKYKKLVPSLHSEVANPDLKLENTRFRLSHKYCTWEAVEIDEKKYPLTAGVSSFGAGGSNAHVIIQEYPIHSQNKNEQRNIDNVFVFSAKKEASLRNYLGEFKKFIQRENIKEIDLPNIAYTLQTGREVFDVRAAIVCNSVTGLLESIDGLLSDTLEGKLYIQKELSNTAERMQNIAELVAVAKKWIHESSVDWSMLESRGTARRIPLPTYYYDRKRYWVSVEEENTENMKSDSIMIDENISNLEEIAFIKKLQENQSYVKNHKVDNKNILAGALMIEMMSRAAKLASKARYLKLQEVLWNKAIEVEKSKLIKVTLCKKEENVVTASLYESTNLDKVVCQSTILLSNQEQSNNRRIEIQKLLKNSQQMILHDEIYDQFSQMGLTYNNEFKSVKQVYIQDEISIAHIIYQGIEESYEIHPFIFDAALQSVIGLNIQNRKEHVEIPYRIDEIEIYGQLSRECYALAERDPKQEKYNITVIDLQGNIQMLIKGLTVEKIKSSQKLLMYKKNWIKKEIVEQGNDLNHILLFDTDQDLFNEMKARQKVTLVKPDIRYLRAAEDIYHINPADKEDFTKLLNELKQSGRCSGNVVFNWYKEEAHVETSLELSIYSILWWLQSVSITQKIKLLSILKGENPVYLGLSGLFKSLQKENNKIEGKVIHLNHQQIEANHLLDIVRKELNDTNQKHVEIKYSGNQRFVKVLNKLDLSLVQMKVNYTPNGCYIITGGSGKLGLLFAEYLAKKSQGHVVLLGRSKLNESRKNAIHRLKDFGLHVDYYKVDITNRDELKAILGSIRRNIGEIKGVIHAAGTVRDSLYMKKTKEGIDAVISPKVKGTMNLDVLTQYDKLHFFVMFSSLSGEVGNVGQTDYAFGNSFLDSFSHRRNEYVSLGERFGKTISINWPLWKNGGMNLQPDLLKKVEEEQGMVGLSNRNGLLSFEYALTSNEKDVVVIEGNEEKLDSILLEKPKNKLLRQNEEVELSKKLRDDLQNYLIKLVCGEIKLDIEDFSIHHNFETYGVDSVVIMNLTSELEIIFGELPKTLFFEYTSVKKLTDYFLISYPHEIKEYFGNSVIGNSDKGIESHMHESENITFTTNMVEEPTTSQSQNDIAIIGIDGVYPQADNLNQFWQNLKEGKHCVTEIPKDRWDNGKFFNEEQGSIIYCNHGGFINDINKFDSMFFNISPREAKLMDPQERLFLQSVWHTIEDAGYSKEDLSGKNIGVFVGVMYGLYQLLGNELFLQDPSKNVPASTHSSIANRVSFYYNFTGPSMAIDTMCSSSLTALHLACNSIKNGECEVAIAGGVNLSIHPYKYKMLSQGNFLSAEGKCRSFGEGGDGYVPGEGVGSVLLKPLSKAINDNDHIYGVIKSITINHGGNSTGYSVPNPNAQGELIGKALELSGVNPQSISYIECHGTGTALGDPIELRGLNKAYSEKIAEPNNCKIGSVKSNIGHLEAAAGIASLTKVLLQMKNKTIVPSLHSDIVNKNLDFSNGQFTIAREVVDWEKPILEENGQLVEYPRIAGISSFGAGGSNVHMIIQEWEKEEKVKPINQEELIVLSAKSSEALKNNCRSLVQFFKNKEDVSSKADIAKEINIQLRKIVSEVMLIDFDQIDTDENLIESTNDSLNLSKICNQINKEFNLKKSIEMFSVAPTIKDLSMLIIEENNVSDPSNYSYKELSLREIAYTLQCGREHMVYRIAIKANSISDVIHQLDDFLMGTSQDITIRHCTNNEQNSIEDYLKQEGMFSDPYASRDLDLIKKVWLKGYKVEWAKLYHENVGRVSLPGYSFDKQSHWVSVKEQEYVPVIKQEVRENPSAYHSHEVNNREEGIEMHGHHDEIETEELLELVQEAIVKSLSEILEIHSEEFDYNSPFLEFGVDSVLAVEITTLINKQLNISLRTTDLFNNSSIYKLSEYIVNTYIHQLNSLGKQKVSNTKEESIRMMNKIDATAIRTEVGSESMVKETPNELSHEISDESSFEMVDKDNQTSSMDIAIIGISGMFPGAKNVDEFWSDLENGVNSVRVPKRWPLETYYSEDRNEEHKSYCKWMGELDDIESFDSLFFSISPNEAEMMDPQQRLVLMESWKALEDAGYSSLDLNGSKCGVFVGCAHSDYVANMRENHIIPKANAFMGNDESILASRISYFLNMRGPSVGINTACSSSLVAIQMASESILNGNCTMALAGGVAVLTTPEMHIMSSKSNMLSSDGKCKAFDAEANGFIPSEGVGFVVLKPLDKAVADGDNIYAVIKGGGINQDGRTNGITAPNGLAQTELQEEVYDKFGINPEDITYVEAHGTGTKLGDPIEIQSLKDSFSKYTKMKNYCGIGSVKSNIAHTLTAAGVAGLIKIVLCMKNNKLVPSINIDNMNPLIELEDSPFYINRELMDWKAHDKLAAINSFGFSGTNAHLVLSNYHESKMTKRNRTHTKHLVVISAKEQDVLVQKVRDLQNWLEKNPKEVEIADIAYTLMVGREQMEHRVGFIVNDREELAEELAYISRVGLNEYRYYNEIRVNVKKNDTYIRTLLMDMRKNSANDLHLLEEVRELYLSGHIIPWYELVDRGSYKRLHLPTYPFQYQYHWLYPKREKVVQYKNIVGQLIEDKGHEAIFKYTLEPDDILVTNHMVQGEKVLPGVTYLEILYQAVQKMNVANMKFESLTWLRPIIVMNQSVNIFTFIKKEGESYSFKIKSGEDSDVLALNCMGRLTTQLNNLSIEQSIIEEINDFRKSTEVKVTASELYQAFKEVGLNYGYFFRSIEKIQASDKKALSTLIATNAQEEGHQYYLNPFILDGALQTISGIVSSDGEAQLPFEFEALSIYRLNAWEKTYAYVKEVARSVYNIYLINENFELMLELNNIVLRKNKIHSTQNTNKENNLDLYYGVCWNPIEGKIDERNEGKYLVVFDEESSDIYDRVKRMKPTYGLKLTNQTYEMNQDEYWVDGKSRQGIRLALNRMGKIDHVIYLAIGREQKEEKSSVKYLRFFKELLNTRSVNHNLTITNVTNNVHSVFGEPIIPHSGDIQGFSKSLGREYKGFTIRNMDIDIHEDMNTTLHLLIERSYQVESGEELVIRNNQVFNRRLYKEELNRVNKESFKQNGVYIILGGAGGIGYKLAEFISKEYSGHIVLVGRSPLDTKINNMLQGIEGLGGTGTYVQCNISNKYQLEECKKQILRQFGRINGVIHSALVLKDMIVENLSEEVLERTLEPKYEGTQSVYEVFKNDKLDFILFFSSVQSFTGNMGQSNYAAGCYYKDSYANYMAQNLGTPVKIINWGYWGSVGVVATEEYKQRIAQQGVYSIEAEEGMAAIERVITSDTQQVVVIKAEDKVIEPMLVMKKEETTNNVVEMNKLKREFDELEKFSKYIMLCIFREFNIFHRSGERYAVDHLPRKLGIHEKYIPLMEEMLRNMEKEHYIQINNNRELVTTNLVEELNTSTLLEHAKHKADDMTNKYPNIYPHVHLLKHCLDKYKDILTGKVLATDILFPNSSMELVGSIYKGNSISDYFNQSLANYVYGHLENTLDDKVSILEIGAGTGGTSEIVFNHIDVMSNKVQYYYTDISQSFVSFGKRKYGSQREYVDFKVLDIERDVHEQGYHDKQFDIIIATNVLHATKDISNTIRNIGHLIKDQGLLLINEATEKSSFASITFGLLDGWWLFKDGHRRIEGSPLLNISMWKEELGAHQLYLKEEPNSEYGQNVLVVQKDPVYKNEKVKNSVNEPLKTEVKSNGVLNRSNNYNKRQIVEVICSSISKTLGVPAGKINHEKAFTDYGIDSISGIDLIKEINETLGLNLKTTTLFDYYNVNKLAAYIEEVHHHSISLSNNSNITESGKNVHASETEEEKETNLKLIDKLVENEIDVDELLQLWR